MKNRLEQGISSLTILFRSFVLRPDQSKPASNAAHQNVNSEITLQDMSDNSSDLFGSISISDDQKPAKPPEKKVAAPKKQKKEPKTQKRRSTSGILKLFFLIFAGIGIYAGIGFILVPYLVKNILPDYLGENLHVKVSISDARFSPFDFQLTLSGISVETHEDGEPQSRFLSVADATIDLDFLSLLRGDLVCSTMEINRLNARIDRDRNKRYNISYLLHSKSKSNGSGIIDFAELPFLFSLNNIRVLDSQIIFDDKSSGKTHHVEDIELALPAISNFPYHLDTYIHPRFSAVVNGSPVKLTGETTLGGTSRDGRQTLLSCDLDDIDIPLYFDYLPVALPIDAKEGRANGKLQISFSPDQEQSSKLQIQFSFTATDLALESRNSKLSLKVPTAKFEGALEPFSQSLTIQSMLLREPTISSEGNISRETMASLIPLTLRPKADDPLYQVIPSISIKLLIADGGSVIIKSNDKKPVRIWHSIQLSLKNFTNTRLLPSEEENSFRLSGEHLSSSAFFTWQGQFDKENKPGGNLQLNNIAASYIAPFLGKNQKDIDGIADISGLLNLGLQEKGDKPFNYTLKSTRVSVKNLALKENGQEWLRVPELRCEPVSRIDNITDLGNIFLKNSSVTLDGSNLPSLFQNFSKRPAEHIIHGIDFSGTISISDKNRKIDTVAFTNAIFQANRLEQQQISEENFVFSATVNQAGSLKTNGTLHIAPLQVAADIAFSSLKPLELFSWFSTSPTFRQSQASLSGQGTFRYPQKRYEGNLSAENVVIGAPQKPVFQASTARFDELSWAEQAQLLSINYILVENPEFSWQRPADETNPAAPLSRFLRLLFLPEPGSGEKDPGKPMSAFSVAINQVDYKNGTVSYQDNRISPPLALDLTTINGSLNKLEHPGKESSAFKLTGNMDGHPFGLEGTGNLFQDQPFLQSSFSAQLLPLSLFSEQITQKVTGINPLKGSLSVQSSSQFNNDGIQQSARIVGSGLLPQSPASPAALALSLLAGADDTIALEVETKGDPKTALLSETLRSVSTSIIKTSINPILLAGQEFKDLMDSQYVSFLPGSSQLTGESIERLNRVSEFIGAHPRIKMKVTGYVDKIEDYTAIYNNLVELERNQTEQKNRLLLQEWKNRKEAEDKLIAEKLAEQNAEIKETDIPADRIGEFVPVLPRQVEVNDTMLQILAMEREKNIISFLIDKLNVPLPQLEHADPDLNRIKNGESYSRADLSFSALYSDTALQER